MIVAPTIRNWLMMNSGFLKSDVWPVPPSSVPSPAFAFRIAAERKARGRENICMAGALFRNDCSDTFALALTPQASLKDQYQQTQESE